MARDGQVSPRKGSELLIPAISSDANMWRLTAVKESASKPFLFRVQFRPGIHLDAEAQVIKGLVELLWVEHPQTAPRAAQANPGLRLPLQQGGKIAASRVSSGLRALRARHSDTVLDFVVPVLNVVLHAPCYDVRNELWENFVLESARTDSSLGHMFFWALKAVATSPQVEEKPHLDAQMKLNLIRDQIFSKAQLSATLNRLQRANEAIRKGSPIPKAPKIGPQAVTPLVDICERLHFIGEEIVKVKDRDERLETLRTLVQKEINEKSIDSAPVPVQMLAPHALAQKPKAGSLASVLKMTTKEARVLSSKARAPYLVVLEVEQVDSGQQKEEPKRGILGCLCRQRRPPETKPSQSGTGASHWPPVGSSPSAGSASCRSDGSSVRPKGAFNDETWADVVARVRRTSEYGKRPNWSLLPLIVKSNADDVRQEELAYRLLKWFERVFRRHSPRLWLQPFLIIATSHDGGVLEVVSNAISISDLKKTYGESWTSLSRYFQDAFPARPTTPGMTSLRTATVNFIWSMAAYSVVCYILAIRDRHNGNIMLDDEGHVLHVDFGFMLCGAPGGKAMQSMGGFELSQGFKLTSELIEVLGEVESSDFKIFRGAVIDGMMAVRAHAEELLALLQLSMLGSENNKMNCFAHSRGYPEAVLEDVCERLGLPGSSKNGSRGLSDEEFRQLVDRMIDDSVDHWRSRLYDKYQYHFVGVH